MKPRLSHILFLLAGLTVGVSSTIAGASLLGSSIFRDVKPGSYYDAAVGAMSDAGIIKGYADGRFGPDDYVTRGQVAVMMQRLRVELGLADPFEENSTSSRTRSSAKSSSSESDEETSSSSSSRSSSTSSAAASLNPRGTIRFTAPAYTVNEKDGTATISVVRTGGNDGTVAIEYALEPGTATAGDDYEAAIATLTFQGKATSATFTVKILNDSVSEGTETVKITLRNPTNSASLGSPSTAELRINDDEAPSNSSTSSTGAAASSSSAPMVGFSALEYTAAEAGGSITITVARTGGTNGAVTVQYATSDNSAKSGTDYNATSGTLSFASGEASKTFTVSILDDTQIDGNKNFKLALTNPTGGVGLETATVTVVVYDDDAFAFGTGSLRFSKSSFDGFESQGKAYVVVQRAGGAKGAVSVSYATNNGSALAGSDYTATSGVLTFAPGESSKTFVVPILYDEISDGDETINLILSNPTNKATLGSPSTAELVVY